MNCRVKEKGKAKEKGRAMAMGLEGAEKEALLLVEEEYLQRYLAWISF